MIKKIVMAAAMLSPALAAASTPTECLVVSQAFEGFSRMRQDGYPWADAEYMIKRSSDKLQLTKLMLSIAKDAYSNPVFRTDEERNAAVNMHATTWLVTCLSDSSGS